MRNTLILAAVLASCESPQEPEKLTYPMRQIDEQMLEFQREARRGVCCTLGPYIHCDAKMYQVKVRENERFFRGTQEATLSGRCGDNAMRLSIETDRHVPFSCRKGAYGDGVCWLANRFVLNENSFKVPAGVLQKACVDFAAQFDSTAAAMTFVERCFQ